LTATRHFVIGRIAWLAMLASWAGAVSASDDVLLLTHGGWIHGHWENRDKDAEQNYVIALPDGGNVTLSPSQVQRIIDGNRWEVSQSETQDAPQFEPIDARLGTRPHYTQSRGYQRYAGRWRTAQDIQLIEERQETDRAQKEWLRKLRQWRTMLGTDSSPEAYRNIRAVTDPMAVPALRQLLAEERYRQPKLLYLDVLGQIGHRASWLALAEAGLRDPDEEIFHASLAQLMRHRPPHISQPYLDSLSDRNNIRVNRAAHALGRLGDPSCMVPLIDALFTTHYVVLQPKRKGRTTTFVRSADPASSTPWGGIGFSSGNQPLVLGQTLRNEEVLQALILLSGGANFGFDQRAWTSWLANQNQHATAIRVSHSADISP
jgi:hypothetical protein